MPSRELELKLTFDEKALERFASCAALRNLDASDPVRKKLRSVYYDTADLALLREGKTLRIRRVDQDWVQTVKGGAHVQSGVSNTLEIETSVPGNTPFIDRIDDSKVREQIQAAIGDKPLRPVVETDMWRTTRLIEVGNAGLVELAIDHGKISANGKSIGLDEVEVELKSGPPHTLLTASEMLFKDQTIEFSNYSKAELGYALIVPEIITENGSKRAGKRRRPALSPLMTAAAALSEITSSAAQQILKNWQLCLVCDDPEGPHQMRIGLRRLRTVTRAFGPLTAGTELRPLARTARDLARVVGHLRDADVMIDDIYSPAAPHIGSDPNHEAMLDLLETNRQQQRETVRLSLRDPKWTGFKLNCALSDAAIARALAKRDNAAREGALEPLAQQSLQKAWRKVRKWGQHLDELSIPERHEMRKSLKSLRYATEFFLSLYDSKEARRFLKQLKHLQDVFGYLNDVAMAEQLPRLLASGHSSNPELQSTAGQLCDWHRARAADAWTDVKQRWDKLKDAPRYWR